MSDQTIITNTVAFVKTTLASAEGGHDWWHVHRVWKNAQYIGRAEGAVDMMVVELGALLHDIADAKFHDGDEEVGPTAARNYLLSQDLPEATVTHVEHIVRHISFRSNLDGQQWTSPELAVVQDADRLDSLGAIGIARAFSYGGHKGCVLYDPAIKPEQPMTKAQYTNSTAPTLNHFYEKLLLLQDRMNTVTGKQMAADRHAFMEQFLERFYAEWAGEC